jgi:hypothetical protein
MLPVIWTSFALMLVVPAQAGGKAPSPVPSLPGDGDLDWSIDVGDFLMLDACLSGPGLRSADECATYDLDGDGSVDLHDIASFQTAFTGQEMLSVSVDSDACDGTEVDRVVWFERGFLDLDYNLMGAWHDQTFDTGLRVHLPLVHREETFVYARLVLPGTGYGFVGSGVSLRIVGVAQSDPAEFSVLRPSQLPKTTAAVDWVIASNWPDTFCDSACNPLNRYSPDISAIVNEVTSRPDWGGDGRSTMAIVIEGRGSSLADFLVTRDYCQLESPCQVTIAPKLELYRTLRSTFVGKELLGAPTDDSVTVNAMSLVTLEVYFEYGNAPDSFDKQTAIASYPGGTPIETLIGGLSPDMQYWYRMRYRRPGETAFAEGPQHSFHTQRAPGSAFTFAVQADSHLVNYQKDPRHCELYRSTLRNIWTDAPDFLVDLGDTFNSESYGALEDGSIWRLADDDALDFDETVERHLAQRPYLDLVCHSAPFFFALGNHEGEQGWRLDGTPNNLAVWATNARKLLYPLPTPGSFYTGNEDQDPFCGLRQDYYAWQWGDALFVVLDPFWYTTSKPHSLGNVPGSGDNWDWTLGQAQYEWLVSTLKRSSATFKFVFAHQVTGGVNTYGRGGIEAAQYAVARRASFEWGGEDANGNPAYETHRPGWRLPIHQIMADSGVTIFFHGHDHAFVKQDLDGVIYQECPQPTDSSYGPGLSQAGDYSRGDRVNNSGHLRVSVSPATVTVEYIRAYLPGDGLNGEVAFSYTISAR